MKNPSNEVIMTEDGVIIENHMDIIKNYLAQLDTIIINNGDQMLKMTDIFISHNQLINATVILEKSIDKQSSDVLKILDNQIKLFSEYKDLLKDQLNQYKDLQKHYEEKVERCLTDYNERVKGLAKDFDDKMENRIKAFEQKCQTCSVDYVKETSKETAKTMERTNTSVLTTMERTNATAINELKDVNKKLYQWMIGALIGFGIINVKNILDFLQLIKSYIIK